MIRARRRNRREMLARADQADVGEQSFETAHTAGASYAEMEAAWRSRMAELPPAGAFPAGDPRHVVEVESWWRNTQRLRAAPRSKATGER